MMNNESTALFDLRHGAPPWPASKPSNVLAAAKLATTFNEGKQFSSKPGEDECRDWDSNVEWLRIWASAMTMVGCGNGGEQDMDVGEDDNGNVSCSTGLLRPSVTIPAVRWKRECLLTTCGVECVRVPMGPPYGVIGNTWVVPRNVLTATQRESMEKVMSCTRADVSPLRKGKEKSEKLSFIDRVLEVRK